MTVLATGFLPSRHGFHFPNDFRNPIGPFSTYGRCNGMSWSALDYFNAGRSAPAIADVDYERPLESGVAAAIDAGGDINLFAVRSGAPHDIVGRSLWRTETGAWGLCAGGATSLTPAAACARRDRTDMIVIGEDSHLYIATREGSSLSNARKDCSGGGLTGFSVIEGKSAHPAAIASPHPDRLEVYHVSADDRSLRRQVYDGGWSSQMSLGGEATSGCAAVSHDGFMAAYVRGNDQAIWECQQTGSGAPRWRAVDPGGVFSSGPAAASPGPGRIELYGRGLDGAIWQNIRDGDHWSGWTSLGGPPGGCNAQAPAAVAAPGLMQVFAQDRDGRVWFRRWQNGAWQNWHLVDTFTDASRRLTDAITARNLSGTIAPIVATFFGATVGAPAVLALNPWGKYILWLSRSDDETFRWTATEELPKLIASLRAGIPIPLGLMAHGSSGHEVVAYGLETDADLDHPHALPGDFQFHVRVYDPNHPGCDDNRISFDGRDLRRSIDERHPAIMSSSGEHWRGCFVRTDYSPAPPPV